MKVYVVTNNNGVKLVTTSKEKAEAKVRSLNLSAEFCGGHPSAYYEEHEVEE
jgi:hypothetical protein